MKSVREKEKYPTYEIIAEGIKSNKQFGAGKFYTVVILDKNIAKELNEIINTHIHTPPGDVETFWTRPSSLFSKKIKRLVLKIKFHNPTNFTFGINFNLKDTYNIVLGIFESQGLIIQTGTIGDKVSEQKNTTLLIEVPNMGFEKKWKNILVEQIRDDLKKQGENIKDIPKLTREHIEHITSFYRNTK